MREVILRTPIDRAGCVAAIQALDLARPWRLSWCIYRKKRSLAQNRLWWLYLGLIAGCLAEHTGDDWTAEDVHDWAKAKFCPPKAVEVAGDWTEVRSTRKLNTEEFKVMADKLYRFCVERMGFILPTPGMWEECRGDTALCSEKMNGR